MVSLLSVAQIYLRIRLKVLEADGVPFGCYPCSSFTWNKLMLRRRVAVQKSYYYDS